MEILRKLRFLNEAFSVGRKQCLPVWPGIFAAVSQGGGVLAGECCRVAGSPVPRTGPVRVCSRTRPHAFDPLVYMHPLNTDRGAATFFHVVLCLT